MFGGKSKVWPLLEQLGGTIVFEYDEHAVNIKYYQLTLLGVLLTDQGDDYAELLTRYLKYVSEQCSLDALLTKVHSQKVAADLGLNLEQTFVLGHLIRLGPFSSSVGIGPEEWNADVPDNIEDLPDDLATYIYERALRHYDPHMPVGAIDGQTYFFSLKSRNISMLDSASRPLNVFLCHSSGDKPTVRELYQRLDAEGWIDAWLDTEKLYPGHDWNFEIEQAVEAADVILVCLSKSSVTKEGYVQRELRIVLDLAGYKPEGTLFVIPVRLEDCDPPRRLRAWQYADYFPENERDRAYQRLLASLRIRADKVGIAFDKPESRVDESQTNKKEFISSQPVEVETPRLAQEKAVAEVQAQLDLLASQAIQQELRGDFWNALQAYYKIKRIDPLFPRVDVKIIELEGELQRIKVETQPNNLRLVIRSLARIAIIAIAVLGGSFFLFTQLPALIGPSTPMASLTFLPSETSVVVVIDETGTFLPVTDTPAPTPIAVSPILGGADKIAFVANKEIWLMNVDGSDIEPLTFDGGVKSDLQWLPDGETIVFLSGLTVKYYNISTDRLDILATFPSEVSLEAFQVSHDGKQVMLAMSNEIFVVPFNLEAMKGFTNRSQVLEMEGSCILPTRDTPAALIVKEARWSADDQLVAWLFKDYLPGNPTVPAEQVGVFDITACAPESISFKHVFPRPPFIPTGYTDASHYELPDFDWDGFDQFVFNTSVRYDGWGYLYIYNWITHKPTRLLPSQCCFRDARWSPDGTYILYEFQDLMQGAYAQTELYYVPVGELKTDANFTPIPLPSGFFKDPREAAQPALRPAQ